MLLKQDYYVKNPKVPDWGIGKVVSVINQDMAEVFFEHAGFRKFNRKTHPLKQVDTSNIDTAALDRFDEHDISDEKKEKFMDLPSSQKFFLQEYPDGFEGEKYKEHERDYKDAGHAFATEQLSQETLTPLMEEENYEEIVARALRVANKTNLIFPNEKMALKDGFKNDENKRQFAQSLFNLLYAEGELKERFEGWIKTLEHLGADKWTTATYYLFFLFPDKQMFVKPTITQAVADMSAFDIAYSPRLNWETYRRVLEFSEYLKTAISELEPQDMIDVQSFMWCVIRAQDKD